LFNHQQLVLAFKAPRNPDNCSNLLSSNHPSPSQSNSNRPKNLINSSLVRIGQLVVVKGHERYDLRLNLDKFKLISGHNQPQVAVNEKVANSIEEVVVVDTRTENVEKDNSVVANHNRVTVTAKKILKSDETEEIGLKVAIMKLEGHFLHRTLVDLFLAPEPNTEKVVATVRAAIEEEVEVVALEETKKAKLKVVAIEEQTKMAARKEMGTGAEEVEVVDTEVVEVAVVAFMATAKGRGESLTDIQEITRLASSQLRNVTVRDLITGELYKTIWHRS